jgi:hypothetical protein
MTKSQIPKPKTQNPKPKTQNPINDPMTSVQIPVSRRPVIAIWDLGFGIWDLIGFWFLGFGHFSPFSLAETFTRHQTSPKG